MLDKIEVYSALTDFTPCHEECLAALRTNFNNQSNRSEELMINFRTFLGYLSLVVFAANAASGQGTQADYDRMKELRQRTRNKVFRTSVQPNWLDSEHLWYRVKTGPRSHEFVLVDLESGKRELAFDHSRVANTLAKKLGKKIDPDALPLDRLFFSDDASKVYFVLENQRFVVDRAQSRIATAQEADFAEVVNTTSVEIRPSSDKGDGMHIEIFNDTQQTIKTIWIDREGGRVPYEKIEAGRSLRQHTFQGHIWLIEDADGTPLALYEANDAQPKLRVDGKNRPKIKKPRSQQRRSRGRQQSSARSPDGNWEAFVRDGNLFARDLKSNQEKQLAKHQSGNHYFSDRNYYWSPNSEYLVAIQVEPGEEHTVYLIESSPDDQVQPKLHQMNYLKPGDKLWKQTPHLFKIKDGKEVEINEELFKDRWEINDYRWKSDSSEFSFYFNQRGHQTVRIIGIDPTTGRTRAIINEETESFVDYTNKVFKRYLEDSDEIIWMSERDGWNHLYLYDWTTGKVKNQITQGKWVVRGVDRVDEASRQIWFRASGIFDGQDPYFIHHCRVNFDGSEMVVMTEGNGTHTIAYSPDRKYLIGTYSRADLAPVTTLRRVNDGSLVCELERGDWSALQESGWRTTIPFHAKGRDDKTDIWGIIYLPTNFDEQKKYPVIEYIYAGPHNSFVPKNFRVHNSQRELAELGFIVVQVDGMGTSNRSKAFHDVCWKNLGDSGFPDRIRWMKAAAKKYPQMDLTRVGIYGGSAGGQSSLRALLAFGDFYDVAVSDCGCHDNRMDKVWWNEQWMGYPIGPHYKEQSNVTNAHRLKGKLLLTVGELDRNVDPTSTMQVVDALIKADKDFDLLVVPGGGHGIGEIPYARRRRQDFFVRHLMGVEPRN